MKLKYDVVLLLRYTDASDPDGCWPWLGHRDAAGYGRLSQQLAHRLSYQHHIGDIPGDLPLDHLCRNTACVNPNHLEAVPLKVNTLRGVGPTALNAVKVGCPHDHGPYDLVRTRSNGVEQRDCRRCTRIRAARTRARRRTEREKIT